MLKAKDSSVIVKTIDPISKDLFSKLTEAYIPLLSKKIPYYHSIKIVRNTIEILEQNEGFIGTGVSCGVDSSYTIAKYTNDEACYKLTHLVYYSMGLYGGMDSVTDSKLIDKAVDIAKQLNLSLIVIRSNIILKLYNKAYAPVVPFVFMGTALCMQNFFSKYYYSSGVTIDEFEISPLDAAYFDILSINAFSNNSIEFYSSGYEVSRYEKVRYISDYRFTYKNLTVCLTVDQSKGNCGRCAKCTRTMTELDSMGELDLYNQSFDVLRYKEDKAYHWGYILLKSHSDPFCKEILINCRKNNYHIPLSAYFSALYKWIKRGFTTVNKQHEMIDVYYNVFPKGD